MPNQTHSGSCLCGAVKFEVHGTFESFYLCHCTRCQKDSGSAHGANLFSSTAKLEWLQGQNQVRAFQLPGTRHAKAFCQNCGSGVPSLQKGGALVVVPAGSLDTSNDMKITARIYCASAPAWAAAINEAPKYDKLPI